VKCDGDPRGCGNCKRLQYECSLSTPPTEIDTLTGSQACLERRRVRKACIACRDRRSKCSGSLPSCLRCYRLGLDCQYPNARRASSLRQTDDPVVTRGPSDHTASNAPTIVSGAQPEPADLFEPPTQVPVPSLRAPDISRAAIKQCLDGFFEFVYPIPCLSFLHRASTFQAWSQGTINSSLLRAICSVVSPYIFSVDAARSSQARGWLQEAEDQLLARFGEPCVSDIEAWVLVAFNHAIAGRFGKMLVSMSLVARLAYIMRLHWEDERSPFLERERRRRLMWAIYILDTLYSSAREEFTSCPANTIRVQLPCKEFFFTMDVPVVTQSLTVPPHVQSPSSTKLGLMAYCIRVLDIRDRVNRTSLAMINHQKPLVDSLNTIGSLEQELQQFHNSLPLDYHFDQKNFFLRAYTPLRTTFLMLHAWWHQTHCDLFRFTIPGFREGLSAADMAQLSPDYLRICRAKCLSNALSVSGVLELGNQPGIEIITDPSVAMCAFHSSRIISRLGHPPLGNMPQQELIERLSTCFVALEKQAEVYPRSSILKDGIMELVEDARRTPSGSIWEAKEDERINTEASPSHASTASQVCEVYSRFSVTDEIRKMSFQSDGKSNNQGARNDERPPETQPIPATDLVREEQQAVTGESSLAPAILDSGVGIRVAEEDRAPNYSVPVNEVVGGESVPMLMGDMFNFDFAMAMAAIDPRQAPAQPDMFLDSFWPIAGTLNPSQSSEDDCHGG
ncbi:unnamed protein product, partial [Clonostachys rhizophaga]